MRRNTDLYGMAFCLGPEDAVYLVGKVPASLVDEEELDRIAGSSILYVDDHFPTAMTLAHPTLYRRRRAADRRAGRRALAFGDARETARGRRREDGRPPWSPGCSPGDGAGPPTSPWSNRWPSGAPSWPPSTRASSCWRRSRPSWSAPTCSTGTAAPCWR